MKSAHAQPFCNQYICINSMIQEGASRSNSSFDNQKNSRGSKPVYKGVLGFSKSKDLKGKAVAMVPVAKGNSYKLPHIGGHSQNNIILQGIGSPNSITFNPREMFKVNNKMQEQRGEMNSNFSIIKQKPVPGGGNPKRISQSNSSNNVGSLSQYSSPTKPVKWEPPLQQQQDRGFHKDGSMVSLREKVGAYLSEDKYNKTEKNICVYDQMEADQEFTVENFCYGDELIDDEEDFSKPCPQNGLTKGEPQYLDQLGDYQDDDEGLEEDDEVVCAEERLDLEENEENEEEDDQQTVCTGLTGSQTNVAKKSVTGSTLGEKGRGYKSKRKSTVKKRKGLGKKNEGKLGYSEGGEEQKTQSFGDSQTNWAPEVKPIQESQEVALPSGPKPKLKQDLLLRPPNNTITVLKSPFAKRPGTVFFPYPAFLRMQRDHPESLLARYSQQELVPNQTISFKINSSTHTYNCVVNSLKTAGFRLISGGAQWNLLWTGIMKPNRLKQVNQYQKINHFPGCWFLGRKDNLWRNIFRMKRSHGQDYNIAPQTYIFPEDYKRWCIDREIHGYKHLYIMKPAASSCGRGIRMVGKKTHVGKKSGYVVSKYVAKPHTLKGFKYDLRIYVVVTCFDPLKVYLFEDGLVRLATQQYASTKSTLSKRFVHLTNFSVNKKAANYVPNKNLEGGEEASSKWCFAQLRQEYERQGIDYATIFESIKDVIIKTLLSVEPHIVTNMKQTKYRNVCFELYGFDILLDHRMKPWLLEVNVCPSLSSSSPFDKKIKTTLLCDLLHLVGFQLFDRKKHEKEQEKQVKQRLLGFESQKKNGKEKPGEVSPLQSIQSPIKSLARGSVSPEKNSGARRGAAIQEWIETLSEDDWEILADFEEENLRRGHFNRIFPTASNVDTYAKYFEVNRHANLVIWQYLKMGSPVQAIRSHFK